MVVGSSPVAVPKHIILAFSAEALNRRRVARTAELSLEVTGLTNHAAVQLTEPTF